MPARSPLDLRSAAPAENYDTVRLVSETPQSEAAQRPSLWRYLARYKGLILFGTICLLGTNFFQIGIPWALERSIDALQPGGGGPALARRFALAIALFALVQAAIRIASRISVFNAGRNVEYDARGDLLRRLLALAPSYFRRRPTGDVMSVLTNDLTAVRVMCGFGMLNVVNTLFIYTLVLWRLLAIDARLTMLALLPYPALILGGRLFGRAMFQQSREVSEHLGAITTAAQQDFAGVAVIKSYALETVRGRAFERLCVEFLVRNMRLTRTRGLMMPFFGLMGALGILIVLWAGGHEVIAHRMTLGQFLAFNLYLTQLAWPTVAFGFILSVWQRGMASWARVTEILTAESTLRDGATRPDGPVHGDLSVRGLSISLEGRAVLTDIDLELPAGKTVAVVGRTGSGKSTLAEALARLCEVPPGTVFLDGRDVNDLPIDYVRSAVGYAPQEAFLFSTTIGENIELGRRNGSGTAARGAAAAGVATGAPALALLIEAAGLRRDIAALPAGLDTIVGERGITLSGGQRQRVALARALATSPRLLILDDSLSSVDAETEREILSGLQTMMRGRSAVVISHRVAAIQHADEIVVLEGGRIAERGRHAALLARGGIYSDLYQRQLLLDEIEHAPPPAPAEAAH